VFSQVRCIGSWCFDACILPVLVGGVLCGCYWVLPGWGVVGDGQVCIGGGDICENSLHTWWCWMWLVAVVGCEHCEGYCSTGWVI